MSDLTKPAAVIFFGNGTAAVFDAAGRQMPRYQRGWHGTTVAALEADGVDWRTLDVTGCPLRSPPPWWTPEREAAERDDQP